MYPHMPMASQHSFARVPHAEIPRSNFDRRFSVHTTMDPGLLVPIFVDEILPAQTKNMDFTGFCRLTTQVLPPMDNLYMTVFWFWCPMRLLWDHWVNMNGEQVNPGDSTDYLVPQITVPADGWAVGSLTDYFGLSPVNVPGIPTISAMWHRMYNKIWNQWFRDENLQDSVYETTGDGPDDPDNYTLLRRAKVHDYFTSCLPWPQKGPGVNISLAGVAPVTTTTAHAYTGEAGTAMTWSNSNGTDAQYGYNCISIDPSGKSVICAQPLGVNYVNEIMPDNLVANLSDISVITINALREAFQVQKLYERDARGGTRYTEILTAHFGVTSPDSRLQRVEFLGGGRVPVISVQSAQTSSTNETTPQGNLVANGTVVLNGLGFTKSFVEHGLLMCLACIDADLSYQQGIPRMASRRSRFDFYWPALACLGEQVVPNQEIMAQATTVVDENGNEVNKKPFGYQERWAEYRYGRTIITGKMRSGIDGSLDAYHYAEYFENLPTLSGDFIQSKPPIERTLAVTDEPAFKCDFYLRCIDTDPMPTYSVPGLIDHF